MEILSGSNERGSVNQGFILHSTNQYAYKPKSITKRENRKKKNYLNVWRNIGIKIYRMWKAPKNFSFPIFYIFNDSGCEVFMVVCRRHTDIVNYLFSVWWHDSNQFKFNGLENLLAS